MEKLMKTHLIVTHPKSVSASLNTLNESRSKDPVVMIFGWMGANDQYLKVYSKIYEEKGFPTVRLTVSPLIVLYRTSKMRKYCDKLSALLEETDFKSRPIIFHVFSNGGSFQYDVLSEVLQKDPVKSKLVKGVIIDSGPTPWTFHNSFSVVSMIIGSAVKGRLFTYVLTVVATACALLLQGGKKMQKVVFKRPVYLPDPYNTLKNQDNLCPQLFFYSEADKLVPYKTLEAFIERRKEKGVDVTTKKFKATSHVKHYPSNKLAYCETVFKFLNKVLKR